MAITKNFLHTLLIEETLFMRLSSTLQLTIVQKTKATHVLCQLKLIMCPEIQHFIKYVSLQTNVVATPILQPLPLLFIYY